MKIIVAAVLGVLAVSPAAAVAVLDQQNSITTVASPGAVSGSSVVGLRRVQTITAGITGLMTKIDVQGFDLTGLNIFATTNGVPNDVLLGTGGVATNDPFGFIGFSTNVFVTAGEVFAIEPTGSNGAVLRSANTYAGGLLFFQLPSVNVNTLKPEAQGTIDLGFLTFVDSSIAAVPEPAMWSMLIIGFGAVGAARRFGLSRTRSVAI